METGHWTWLEVVKLAFGLLTPVVLAVGGIYINRITKRFEYAQWKSQKLVEKRLTIYDDMAPMFNDLFCYFTFVGGWRDFSPPSIVAFKRALDKKVYLAAPLFSDEFFAACREFQGLCFKTFNAPGKDARLRTHIAERQAAWVGDWKPEWAEHFSADLSEPRDVSLAYRRVMNAFASDIGVNPAPRAVHGTTRR